MADKVTIINRALSTLGAEPIVALTDNTPQAKIANRYYPESRRSVLGECLWNFATKRVVLNLSTESIAWVTLGMNFVYQLPSDVVRIFETNSVGAQWRVEGDKIISDANTLGIKYVYDLEDTTKFSSSFVDAFADKLASDMCYAILNSNTEAERILKKYEGQSLPKATAENAQEGTPNQIYDNVWVDARLAYSPLQRFGAQ